MNIIAQNIVKRRKELKMTQKELAEKLNISPKTVSRWETGNQIPDALTIPEIAKVLTMTIDELYGQENKNEYEQNDSVKSEVKSETEDVSADLSSKQSKEYPNLRYGVILIFKIALIIGVFAFFGIGTFVAKNSMFHLGSWNLVYGMSFAGVILYLLICQIAFREFYKRDPLVFYYEQKHVKYIGAMFLAIGVILTVWMPWNYNLYSLAPYFGVYVAMGYNAFLIILMLFYILRIKKKGFEIPKKEFIIPFIIFVIAGITFLFYMKFAGQKFVPSLGTYGTQNGENLFYNKMRLFLMVAGLFMVIAQVISYLLLMNIWNNRKILNKKVRIISAVLAFIMIVGIIGVNIDFTNGSVYKLMDERLEVEKQEQFHGMNVSFGIDLGPDIESEALRMHYFTLSDPNHIYKLIEILKDIKIEKGSAKEPVKESKSVHLQFESAIYDTMVINGMTYPVGIKDTVYWDITLHENGGVWYDGEYYQIRNSVNWNELFKLGLSEYDGKNKELILQWIEE